MSIEMRTNAEQKADENSGNAVLKGNVCFSTDPEHLVIRENSYVVCEDGIFRGVFSEIPERYRNFPCHDYGDRLIIPGLIDLHVHAPQYAFRGFGMDMELIDWLNTCTFPEEEKYSDMIYARKAYEIFVEDLKKSATTRACIFATIHNETTLLLMELLENAGFSAYVGKVNMDRNSSAGLCEESAEASAACTEEWIRLSGERFRHVKPILTPRFIPSCSDDLLERLSVLQREYELPVQSHLSENQGEIQWVKELCPGTDFYGEAYDRYGLFGHELPAKCPAVMAHCVHSGKEEMELMKRNHVFIAHCPQSNSNLSSGIAPVRAYLDMGIKMGLGTDIGAGHSLSMFRIMAETIQYSKLRWRLVDQSLAPLKMEEVFYLATKGGGEFFGKVGSFENGYEFDAVVLDDSSLKHPQTLKVRERLERIIYLADDRNIAAKYVQGRKIMCTV